LLVISACNLPRKEAENTLQEEEQTGFGVDTPTPVSSLCENLYFPNMSGDTWEYAGSTSVTGAYTRSDSILDSGAESFSVQSNTSGILYSVDYICSEAGLVATNPIQQYLGAILSSFNGQVSLNLVSTSGISLPKSIKPGDTWQQVVEWEGSAQGISTKGRLVFDYTAAGYESITIASGTFDALRVNTTIRIELTNFHILYGTYEMTTWMAPNVGIIKSVGSSNVPNVNFSDSLELSRFTESP
jgi:hypothetical protein